MKREKACTFDVKEYCDCQGKDIQENNSNPCDKPNKESNNKQPQH